MRLTIDWKIVVSDYRLHRDIETAKWNRLIALAEEASQSDQNNNALKPKLEQITDLEYQVGLEDSESGIGRFVDITGIDESGRDIWGNR